MIIIYKEEEDKIEALIIFSSLRRDKNIRWLKRKCPICEENPVITKTVWVSAPTSYYTRCSHTIEEYRTKKVIE